MTEAVSKQSVAEADWFFLTAHSKIQQERNDLKMELLIKKSNQNLNIWAVLHLFLSKRRRKPVWERTVGRRKVTIG